MVPAAGPCYDVSYLMVVLSCLYVYFLACWHAYFSCVRVCSANKGRARTNRARHFLVDFEPIKECY